MRTLEPRKPDQAVRLGETWIEAEDFAYPNGGFTRRAYVRMPDKSLQVVKVSIPDTFFTIPAKAAKEGDGYVTQECEGKEFVFVKTAKPVEREVLKYPWTPAIKR
jgi:hypothetical protein